MGNPFGEFVREQREARRSEDPSFSLRQLARRIGVEPSYLSKVERGLEAPPSEPRIAALATELGEDPDVLLALAGRVPKEGEQFEHDGVLFTADRVQGRRVARVLCRRT